MVEKLKVLVLEDDPLVRMTVASLVEEAGFIAIEAGTVKEARKLVAEFNGQIRGITADNEIRLPGGEKESGWEFAHELHSGSGLPAIIISGNKPTTDQQARYADMPFRQKPLPSDFVELAKKTFAPERPKFEAGGGSAPGVLFRSQAA